MVLPWRQWLLLPFLGCLGGELLLHGPVFTREPSDSISPAGPGGRTLTLSCEARGHPAPQYRWQLNGTDLDMSGEPGYRLRGGDLVLLSPDRHRDAGSYQCFASNSLGTVASREARVQFAYLDSFKPGLRGTVSAREGQGVVLLCGPPPHSGELAYAWIFNAYPSFVEEDGRRFVSQETGHLYVAKVEPPDVGNYTCVVTSLVTNTRVLGSPTPLVLRADGAMGEYEPKIEVQFPEVLPAAKGSTVKLECFALGNPVPQISWRRSNGLAFPSKARRRKWGGVLEIPDFQQDDAGTYECVAENSRGRNVARGRLTYYAKPHWVHLIRDAELAVGESLHWECRAGGKPKPWYRWLKNGAALAAEERVQIEDGALTISHLRLADAGMFQCVAENKHGRMYASAELRVLAAAPDFSRTPIKEAVQALAGSVVSLDCRPQASPRARLSWKRGDLSLQESRRVTFLKDGGLRIANVTKADAAVYTCVAENQFGRASGTTHLVVTEPTRMALAPSSVDVSVGESVVLPCQVRHDPLLDVAFAWYVDGALVDFKDGTHFEKVGGGSSGDLLIRDAQLRHAGRYACEARTGADSVSSAADLVVRGAPGPPGNVRVDEVTATTARLSWGAGAANRSPVLAHAVQARSPFSVGWQAAATEPAAVDGRARTATVVGLSPWVEYEFRVVASNRVGGGEPSAPSEKVRTAEAAPAVPPADVGGGGGGGPELVITWDTSTHAEQLRAAPAPGPQPPGPRPPASAPPVPEELRSGPGFGYLVAFRPRGGPTWTQTAVPAPDAPRFVFRDASIRPASPYEVRVGVYNRRGAGPFSPVSTVFSAEEEPMAAPEQVSANSLSSSEIQVSWAAAPWEPSNGRLLGYEVRYWADGEEGSSSQVKVAGNETAARLRGLRSNLAYHTAVRAYNSAGPGPFSAAVNTTTEKTPPSQAPGNVAWNSTGRKVLLRWEHVTAAENESEVTGYKVFYRTSSQSRAQVLSTNETRAELLLPRQEDCLVEVKASTAGGDGASSGQVRIPRVSGPPARGCAPAFTCVHPVSRGLPVLLLLLPTALWRDQPFIIY